MSPGLGQALLSVPRTAAGFLEPHEVHGVWEERQTSVEVQGPWRVQSAAEERGQGPFSSPGASLEDSEAISISICGARDG